MQFLGIKNNVPVFEIDPPAQFVYTKMRNSAKGTFLIAIAHPFVDFYYYDQIKQGHNERNLSVQVGSDVVQQEWKGLWKSNQESISSVLKSNGYVPNEVMAIHTTDGTIHYVFKDALELPQDVELYKDVTWKARFLTNNKLKTKEHKNV